MTTEISTHTLTVTLAKAEPVSHTGQLWWTLASDDFKVLPPLGMAPEYAVASPTDAKALAVSYLHNAGVLPSEGVSLPWRHVGHSLDGSKAYRVRIVTTITAG